MKRTIVFFLVTLILGWVFQAVFLYWIPAGVPTPEWLLLAVLALGAQGRTRFAMSLGFLWGLMLDAYGVSAFGIQGWLLALTGYVSGTFSKNLDSEKVGTQMTLAGVATVVTWVGVRILSAFFERSLVGRPGMGLASAHLVLNAMVVPGVFWVMGVWSDFWDPRPMDERDY